MLIHTCGRRYGQVLGHMVALVKGYVLIHTYIHTYISTPINTHAHIHTYIHTYIYMLIQQEKDLDAARDFVPKESKEALKEISTDVAVENGDIYDKTGNAAIVVHTAHIDQDNFMEQACKWRMEKNTPIEKTSTSNSYIDLQCHICYKVTTETTEEDRNNTEMVISSTSSYRETMVSKTAILNNADHCVDIPIFNANIYKTQNITCWTPPIFEVWLSDDDMNCKFC